MTPTGADYADGPWRASGALEVRKASQQDSALIGLGISYRLDSDWTALARSTTIGTADRTMADVATLARPGWLST